LLGDKFCAFVVNIYIHYIHKYIQLNIYKYDGYTYKQKKTKQNKNKNKHILY